jgi:hypothetical protein
VTSRSTENDSAARGLRRRISPSPARSAIACSGAKATASSTKRSASSTLENYAQQYSKHLVPRWGSTLPGAIAPLEIAAFEKELRSHLSRSSATVVMSVLRRMLEDAVFERLRRPLKYGYRRRQGSLAG